MENPFKELEKPLKTAPSELKGKVMKDIAFAKFLIDMSRLFSVNIGDIFERTLKKRRGTN
ncbi:hypothetical protein GCM10022271_20500 [Corallibacter vietnamensis]|uniref:Uncharacterized protein n=1 Tax=Corallibacter vietnamensis TaxID=904130 RepID=A0ABP7HB56_9FLAO